MINPQDPSYIQRRIAEASAAFRAQRPLGADLPRQAAEGATPSPPGPGNPARSPAEPVPVDPGASGVAADEDPRFADPLKVLKNAPASFVQNVKAVLWDVPVTAVKELAGAVVDPAQYWKDLKLATKYLPEIGDMLGQDYADAYWHRAAQTIEEDPFRFVSDAAGAASLGGGAVAGLAGKGSRLGQIGTSLGRVAGLDPAELALKAGMKLPTKYALRAFGITPETEELRALNALLGPEFEKKANQAAWKVITAELNPAQQKSLVRAWAEGENGFLSQLQTSDPKVWEMYQKSREWLLDDEKHWVDIEKVIKGREASRAKVKALVRWAEQEGQAWAQPGQAGRYQAAHDMIYKHKTHNPTFFSITSDAYKEKGLFSQLTDPLYRDGSLSRAELRAMHGKIGNDPYAILMHQIKASMASQKAIALWRGSQEILQKKGLLKAADDLTDIQALRKAGWAPIEGPFFEKYHTMFAKAINHLADAARKPGEVVTNVAQAAEEFTRAGLLGEQYLKNPVKTLWAPEGVAKWLKMELSPAGADHLMGKLVHAFGRGFGLMPYYKALATVFNPRYWLPNLVGGAALSVLYGIHPQSLKYARKFKELLPDELQHFATHDLFMRDMNWFQKKATRFREYAAAMDAFFKGSVYVSDAVKTAMKEGLMKTGNFFFIAADELKPVLADLRNSGIAWKDDLLLARRQAEAISNLSIKRAELMKQQAGEIKQLGKQQKQVFDKAQVYYKAIDDGDYSKLKKNELDMVQALDFNPEAKKRYLEKRVARLQSKIDESSKAIAKTGEAISEAQGELLDKIVERGRTLGRYDEIAKRAQRYERVVGAANKFFGSYIRLTPFERKIVAEFVPFYPFAQAMTRLAFRLPFMFPARHLFYLGLWRMWQDVMEDQTHRSTWARHYTPIMAVPDGNGFIAVRHGAWNPMNSFRWTDVANAGQIPSAWDILGQHPLIRVWFSGRGSMQARPIQPGDRGARLDNGEVWELDGRGGIRRTLATPSWHRTLTGLFPQSQILSDLFHGAVQSDRGSFIIPDVKKGKFGKPLYPIGWPERMMGLVAPTTRIDPAQMRMREVKKWRSIRDQWREELRYASPQRREAIVENLRLLHEDIDRFYLDYGGGF